MRRRSDTRARCTTGGRPDVAASPGTTSRSCGWVRPVWSGAVVIDTANFTGNYPPRRRSTASPPDGHPSVDDLLAATVVPSSCPGRPRRQQRESVRGRPTRSDGPTSGWRSIPDGGVARLRVLGEVVPDPQIPHRHDRPGRARERWCVVDCSDAFYGSPTNLIMPGRARNMGEGWENARRRGAGNDYVTLRLGGARPAPEVEIDTSYFVGNAPGEAASPAWTRGRRRWTTPTPGSRCSSGPACSRTRGTGSGSTSGRSPMSASTSTPTAASRGCACRARSIRTSWRDGRAADPTRPTEGDVE